MTVHENCDLKDQKIAQLKAQVERLEAELGFACHREEMLRNAMKVWIQEVGRVYRISREQQLEISKVQRAERLRDSAAFSLQHYADHFIEVTPSTTKEK